MFRDIDTPVRYTLHEVYAREVHAYEVHAHEISRRGLCDRFEAVMQRNMAVLFTMKRLVIQVATYRVQMTQS